MSDTKQRKTGGEYYTLSTLGRPLDSFIYNQRKIFHPSWFQGNQETSSYFEGWYFKNVSAGGLHVWSFIPGISLVEGDTHAFVQAINGKTGQTHYFRYPAEEFSFSSDGFEVCIGQSFFSDKMLILNLDDGQHKFVGEVYFDGITGYPAWYKRPGIMGWYRYVPFMECYHGVVSLDHGLKGQVTHNGRNYLFDGGRGYIEKDWGSSMPKAWIWMQTNNFEKAGSSFMLSVARIPWVGNTFTGFLGFLLHQGEIISFATYTGAQVRDLQYNEKEVLLTIKGNKYTIDIHAQKGSSSASQAGHGGLKAPVLGNMDRTIHESIDATIRVQVTDRKGKTIFSGTGKQSGFEMVGDMELLRG